MTNSKEGLNKEIGSGSRFRIMRRVCIGLLLIFALVSATQGFLNALEYSQDFQWSPARIFLFRGDPYLVHLNGDPENRILLSQVPNYAQLMYILLAPFAALPFSTAKVFWVIANFLFAIFTVGACARMYSLSRVQLFTIGSLFLMSTPTRNSMGNGQHSLMILAAVTASLVLGESIKSGAAMKTAVENKAQYLWSACLAGLTYIKYSFAPTFGVAFLRRYGLNYFILSFFPVLIGVILFGAWTGQNPIDIAFLMQPYKVASGAVAAGAGDLLTILKIAAQDNSLLIRMSTLFCLLLAGSSPFFVKYSSDNSLCWWSFCSVASLTFVTHLGYDYVFYLFPALYAAKTLRTDSGKMLAALVAYPWFFSKLLISIGTDKPQLLLINFAVNLSALYILYREIRNDATFRSSIR